MNFFWQMILAWNYKTFWAFIDSLARPSTLLVYQAVRSQMIRSWEYG